MSNVEHVATEGEGYLLNAETFQPNLCQHVQDEFIRRCCKKIQAAYENGQIADSIARATIKHEARVHQVEFNSGAHSNMDDFNAEMHFIRKVLVNTARDMGLVYISAGASPVTFQESPAITSQTRYQETLKKLKGGAVFELMKDFDPCAAHFHVEVTDPDDRVRLMNAFQEFLWLFLGLSLSSPITAGNNSGFHSTRQQAWSNFPNSGVYTGAAKTLAEWNNYIEAQKVIGEAEDATTMWYWVRACKKQPTCEVRVADAITYVDDMAPIAALTAALKGYLLDHPERALEDPGIVTSNLNAVTEHGRRAYVNILQDDGSYGKLRFRHAAEAILKDLEPYAKVAMSGTAFPYFEKLYKILDRTAVSSTILKHYHDALAENDDDEAHAEEAVIKFLACATAKFNA